MSGFHDIWRKKNPLWDQRGKNGAEIRDIAVAKTMFDKH
jgi:hypothetical protein